MDGQSLTPEQVAEEQAALDRYNESVNPTDDTNAIPDGYNPDGTPKEELIAGKFKSNEDLLKAYQELEKKLGQPKVEETTTTKVEEVPTEAKGLITVEAFNDFSEEYNKDGKLSESSYKKLEEKGLSKELVDSYIEGEKLKAEVKAQKLLDYVGGKETYEAMVAWAKEHYTPEQAKSFDDALFSGNESRVQEQVDLLAYRINKSDTPVNRIEGESTSGTGGLKAFANKSEWQQAMRNPIYGKDAKYTRMVDNRYLASLNSGTI